MANNLLDLRRPGIGALPGSLLRTATISDQANITVASRALAREASRIGLRLMTWHNLATMEQMVDDEDNLLNPNIFGWDEKTLANWVSLDAAAASPLLKACRVASEALWVNPQGPVQKGRNRFIDQIDFANIEDFVGAKAAIIMPVRMPFGFLGAAILKSFESARDDLSEEFRAFATCLAVPLHRFVRSYVQLTYDDRYLPANSLLSSREIECLNWVAQGKTDSEIGIILGCSHAGVRCHISRACAKLGAVNRSQSVFKACQLGYLGVPSQPPVHPATTSIIPERGCPE